MFTLKHTKYAPISAEVIVRNKDHDPVWLCEYNGVKFPIHMEWLSNTAPVIEEEVKEVIIKPQLTLF